MAEMALSLAGLTPAGIDLPDDDLVGAMREIPGGRTKWAADPIAAASAESSQRSERTGRPDSAWKVSGVTNCRAPAVITTCTSTPRSRRRRTSSALL